MSEQDRERVIVLGVVTQIGSALVIGVLAAMGLLTPLGAWIRGQESLLRVLVMPLLMALVLAFRLPYRRLRWSLALLCGGGLVSWLASILARSQPPTARPTTTGIAAVVGLGVVVFALLEWERRGNQTDGDGGAL